MLTDVQYDAAHADLLDRLSRYYEDKDMPDTKTATIEEFGNKWDQHSFLDCKPSPMKKAEDNYVKSLKFMVGPYLPKMKPNKVLGALGHEDDPVKDVVFELGPVTQKGEKLDSNQNHEDYIDDSGYYDITKYLDDHWAYFLV